LGLRLWTGSLSSTGDASLLVDLDDLDGDDIPFGTTSSTFPPVYGQAWRYAPGLPCRGDFHERAERHELGDPAGKTSPTSGSFTMALMILRAFSPASLSTAAIKTDPSSSISIFAPVSATIFWITLPPER
jgi:hypothetical protein